jgi:hypothetical protein
MGTVAWRGLVIFILLSATYIFGLYMGETRARLGTVEHWQSEDQARTGAQDSRLQALETDRADMARRLGVLEQRGAVAP